MRTSLWFLLFVVVYLQDKCVKSRDVPNGFQATFQSVADFITSLVAKSSSVARDMFSTSKTVQTVGSAQKKVQLYKKFKHHAWEEGEAKYQTTERNSTAAYQLTVAEVAQWHGYNIETHIVKSMDGYFLTTHRLTGVSHLRNRTVLLHHGLLGSSMDWILLEPGECMLPFTLAEAGYDVWFMNARGNVYSRGHATMALSMPQFWDFSFEEMGLMDIPAVIDYIRGQSDVPIDFVAHSMGSTAFLVYLSSLSEYKKYLRTGVLIAPLAFMNNVTGPLLSLPEDTFKPRRSEFLPHQKVPRKLANTYCKGPIRLCRNPLFFLSGVPTKSNFATRVRNHMPAGGSVKTILHYMQLVKTEMFNGYKNQNQYNLSSIDVPLALISSNNDEVAKVKNIQRIYGLIKYPIAHYIIRNKNVTHTDLLWGKTASCVVFRKTLEYLVEGHQKHNMSHESVEKSSTEDNIQDKVKSEKKGTNKIRKNTNNIMGGNDTYNSEDIDDDDYNINVTNNDHNKNEDDYNVDNNDNDPKNNENDNDDGKNDNAAYNNDHNNGDGNNDDNNNDCDDENDNEHDKNNNTAKNNDDNNDDVNNDDVNNDDNNNDHDDEQDDEDVEDDEDEVTDKAKVKETDENEIQVKDKDVRKSED